MNKKIILVILSIALLISVAINIHIILDPINYIKGQLLCEWYNNDTIGTRACNNTQECVENIFCRDPDKEPICNKCGVCVCL